ncbi:MAG: dihydroorotate dehydrogenase [Nitrososphaerales archaeon]
MKPTEEAPRAASQLSFQLGGFRMKNPVMLASGVVGVTLDILPRVAEAGAGAMVTKSISVEPREGYRNPTVVEVECGYVNAVGLSNPGLEAFARDMMVLKEKPIPVVVSLFGSEPDEFGHMVSTLESTPVDCYELNLSCPHVEKVGLEVGQDPEAVSEVVKSAKKNSSRPVLVKVSPNITDVVEIASAAKDAGADGMTAVNTVRAMVIDIETGRPILSNKVGGLSGQAVKPIAVRCVYDISRRVDIPVIGCGGITSWSDAVEFMLAGASAVQVGSAVAHRGLDVFREIVQGIQKYLDSHRLKSIGELVGRSHSYQ